MARVEVNISMSVDGFITGPHLDQYPGLGEGGEILHGWLSEGDRGKILDDVLFGPAGAVVTSRTVYEDTDGWGDDGFYGMPVFVLTHRPHPTVTKGATVFTFVTGGIEEAISRAVAAAGPKKVHVMGGAGVIQQALNAGLVDELSLHVAPVLLGSGTPLFAHLGGPVRLERTETLDTATATHLRFRVLKRS
ncbi:dihydrofolate reductase family protein [Streptomyces sp. NPDC051567]|uniref:dihydrofolate reductase family protein n=1 Tax=Streptomyces sp. NPDC051567 TaxID=3365660 RepID=UPI0037A908E6